ncbi:MAG: hydrogenase maturation nickel metallochaperone HypA [Arenicellales bacterium]|nr:hydrogenase maturation nickel metallochaperone HypA [Arenicellales bacterium]
MHELAVCQALLQQVEQTARQHAVSEVTKVVLRIGPLSGIELPLLQQAFTVARRGTIADKADLVAEELPVRIRCTRCRTESTVSASRLLCMVCGDWRTRLISGDEMVLASIEMTRSQRSPPQTELTGDVNYV